MIELRAKRWPFVESPGQFTRRFAAAMGHTVSDSEASLGLAAMRTVLIEDPPALSRDYFAALPAEAGTMEGALTAMLKTALDKLGEDHKTLQNIARQKTTEELKAEGDQEYEDADFEGGYDGIIHIARRALQQS